MAKKATTVNLAAPKFNTVNINITGESSLIMHKWSEKVKAEMKAKHQMIALPPKGPRVPEDEYEESMYRDGKKYVFPAVAFKASAVRAAKSFGMAMTDARGAFFICGDFVEIKGKPNMREDMVKVGNGSPDLRYRGEFKKWKATLTFKFNEGVISADQLFNLVETAGFSVGVGEWRPERNGTHGCFRIDR